MQIMSWKLLAGSPCIVFVLCTNIESLMLLLCCKIGLPYAASLGSSAGRSAFIEVFWVRVYCDVFMGV